MPSVSIHNVLDTIPSLEALLKTSDKALREVQGLAAVSEHERKMFKDISLSGSIFEVIRDKEEEKKKVKVDDDNPNNNFFKMFSQSKDPIKQVNVANPLGPLINLNHLLNPEYRFLVDNLSVLANVYKNKTIQHTFLGINGLLNNNSPVDRLVNGDITAAANPAAFIESISVDDLSKFDNTVLIDTKISEYISCLNTCAKVGLDVLENVTNFESKIQRLWEETESVYNVLSEEYLHRETNRIIKNPVLTNVLKVLFNDLPGVKEIENGAKPTQVTPYNVRRAEDLLKALASPEISQYLYSPDLIIKRIKIDLDRLFSMYFDVIQVLSSFFVMIRNVNVGGAEERDKLTFAKYQIIDRIRDIKEGLETFDKLSFTHVHPKIKAKTKTAVHPQLIKYVKISHMLSAVSKNPNVAKEKVFDIYTMHRKTRLTHLRSPTETDENPTYYEASQNQMGSIELKALKRPKIKFDDLVGASYNEAKQHIKTMMTYNSYPALFISTSPSKSLKSNILLLGPPGSGKSEIFRSMAGSGKIVVVNVSGASIRSMWYGQSEQNIMLLAKAAEKLHRQTGKIVYVVIDEIDNVLGVPSEGNNLADVDWRLIKTFQEVLDGIRRFDGVVWCGATNNPERLGTAALRRFSFVDAPGELTTDERAQILKNYLTLGLPLAADITDDDFHRYGLLMEGAVGDIVRKVVDDLHEKVFAEFTREHPREAKELETWIKRKEFDVFKLTKRDREFIKRKISRHLVVSKSRLEDLLTAKMSSPDIVREVEEARKTFTRIHDIKSNARERLRPYK